MADFRLVYFKMRALAEAPQLLLRYTGIPYSYEMAWDFFGQPWSEVKASVPYRQLPMLVVDDSTRICQSGAPSNDFTISPPKLRLHAPKNTKNGPGSLFIKFMVTLTQ